jgi:hypothetical protein
MSDKKLLKLEKLLDEYLKEKIKYPQLPIKYFVDENKEYLLDGLKDYNEEIKGLESIVRCLIEVKRSIAMQMHDETI